MTFSLQNTDIFTKITVTLGFIASSAAVAHGILNHSLSGIGLGFVGIVSMFYAIYRVSKAEQRRNETHEY